MYSSVLSTDVQQCPQYSCTTVSSVQLHCSVLSTAVQHFPLYICTAVSLVQMYSSVPSTAVQQCPSQTDKCCVQPITNQWEVVAKHCSARQLHCCSVQLAVLQYGTVCSVHYAVCTMQCALCSVHYAVCTMQCAANNMHVAMCSVQCTVCSMQYAVCSVQCVVYGVQCAVCCGQKFQPPQPHLHGERWRAVAVGTGAALQWGWTLTGGQLTLN